MNEWIERLRRRVRNNPSDTGFFAIVSVLSGYYHSSLLSGGYVINGDFTVVGPVNRFLLDLVPVWHSYGGFSNVVRVSKLFIYAPLFVLDGIAPSTPMTTVYFGYFTVLSVISAFAVVRVSELVRDGSSAERATGRTDLLSYAAGLFYITSPYVVEQAPHRTIKYAFYLAPVVLYLVVVGVENDRRDWLVGGFLVWSLANADIHWGIYGGILVFGYIGFSAVYDVLAEQVSRGQAVRAFGVNAGFGLVLVPLFNSYWLLPGFRTGAQSLSENVITPSSLDLLFRNATLLNLLSLRGNFFLSRRYAAPEATFGMLGEQVTTAILLLFTGVALAGLSVRLKQKIPLFLGVVFGVALVLSGGPNVLPGVFTWLVFDAPLSSWYRWAFRTPKFHQFLILSVAILLPAGLREAYRSMPRIGDRPSQETQVILVALVLVGSLGANYPLLTGTIGDEIKTSGYPAEFDSVDTQVDAGDGTRMMWGPPYGGESPTWNHAPVGVFFPDISPMPTMHGAETPLDSALWGYRWGYDPVLFSSDATPGELAKPLSVEYVAVHADVPEFANGTATVTREFESDPAVRTVHEGRVVRLFRVSGTPNAVRATATTALFGDLVDYGTVLHATNGRATVSTGTFERPSIETADRVVLAHGPMAAGLYVPNSSVTAPYDWVHDNDPSKGWAKARATSTQFQRHVANNEIRTAHPLANGRGVIFTGETGRYPENVTLSNNTRVVEWTFEDGKRNWSKAGSGDLHVSNGAIRMRVNESSSGWRQIRSPAIPVNDTRAYRVQFDVRGAPGHKAHLKVSEVNERGERIRTRRVTFVGDGAFSTNVTATYEPSPNASRARFELWHGHESTKALPNVVSIESASVHDVTEQRTPIEASGPVQITRDGEHVVFVRALHSDESGLVLVEIDGKTKRVRTTDGSGRFAWVRAGTVSLETGTHEFRVTNLAGFNAVSAVSVVPASAVSAARERARAHIRENGLVYVLDASRFSDDVPRGSRLAFRSGTAVGTTLAIPAADSYRFAIEGSGPTELVVDGETLTRSHRENGYTYYRPVELRRGATAVTISTDPTVVSAYTFERNESWTASNGFEAERVPEGDGEGWALRVTTDDTEKHWSGITTNATRVEPGTSYLVTTRLKYQNVDGTHVVVQGYNQSTETWETLRYAPGGRKGKGDYRTYRQPVTPPANVTELRLMFNAGTVRNDSDGNATTWFRDARVLKPSEASFENVFVYSEDAGTSVAGALTPQTDATVTSVERVSATEYRVTVDAAAPYRLVLSEPFDGDWAVTSIDGESTRRSATPVAGAINSFYVRQTGSHTYVIQYQPQTWVRQGVLLSAVSMLCAFGFIALRNRPGERFHREQREGD